MFSANQRLSPTPQNSIMTIGGGAMKEPEYHAGEFSDDPLDALAEAG